MKHHNIGLGVAFTVALGVAAPGLAQQAVQWRVEDGGNGHWYAGMSSGLPSGTSGNWELLRSRAVETGGYLCTIETPAENQVVRDVVTAAGPVNGFWCYLGATQTTSQPCGANSWQWIDGTAWSFSNWQPGQPDCLIGPSGSYDEPRMAIRSFTGAWGDWNDRALNTAVIEWSADCNGDGIVDYGQILDGTFLDVDANGVPDTCECPADLTGDGQVNGGDLSVILGFWGTPAKTLPAADLNGDGTVNAQDLSILLGSWGPCPN